ncbi:WXG100 family type VII secretion target [Nocardia harenae]|uniref:WXG100 family type VII secretion target n=1 Tax=Nocardia harenae TaxID=358707 RepID=UPI000835EF7E|nr:type VII secretion target [Nocardia harenae]
MSQSIEIDPGGVRRAAGEFDAVAERTRRLLDTLTGACASRGEPWGDDKAGRQFADGDKGYRANRDNYFDTLSTLVEVFGDNATNLGDAADAFEVADRRDPSPTARVRLAG